MSFYTADGGGGIIQMMGTILILNILGVLV
jgi:hypothetical protein